MQFAKIALMPFIFPIFPFPNDCVQELIYGTWLAFRDLGLWYKLRCLQLTFATKTWFGSNIRTLLPHTLALLPPRIDN